MRTVLRGISGIFLKGLIAILPVGATIAALVWLTTKLEGQLGGLLARTLPEGWYYPGMGIVAGLVLIFALGILLSTWVMRVLFDWGERQLARLPLVKTVYGSIKDLMGFFSGSARKQGLNQVVLVRVASDCHVIGLVTRADLSGLPEAFGGAERIAVYMPMSYQIGGYTIFIPRERVEPIAMSVEEAMRFAVTAGMSTGKESPTRPPDGGPPAAPPPAG